MGGLAALSISLGAGACSLLAPSDSELLGGVVLPEQPAAGGSSSGANGAAEGGAAGNGGGLSASAGAGEGPPVSELDPPVTSPPDAGEAPCTDCEQIRVSGGLETVLVGSVGGSTSAEICPHDQVAVGFDYEFEFGTPADFGYLSALAVACGKLVPNRQQGTVQLATGDLLPARGVGGGQYGSGGRCPPGQVVTGFQGFSNFDGVTSEVRQVTIECAPLALNATGVSADTIVVGDAAPAPPMSADYELSTVPYNFATPLQTCPPGQVARGAVVHAGQWLDGFSLVCAALTLALPDGAACSAGSDCQSGRCSGTCEAQPCALGEGCSCALFGDRQYAFCSGALAHADAVSACSRAGTRLVNASDYVVHGWLRSTAVTFGIQGLFWLGADDLAVEGSWQWLEQGGAVDLVSRLWDPPQNRGGAAENCLQMTRDAHWDDAPCTSQLPFVCQAP